MKKLLPFILLLPAFAHGTTLTVTSLADDGSAGTLRALCASAAGGDEIVFDDSLAGGMIAIAKTLSRVGPADAPITIDGQGGAGGAKAYDGSSRTTNLIYATDPDATLTLKNLVFTGSKANQASATPDVGPAVSILGSAVIDNCCWTNNGMAQTGSYNDTTSDGGTCLRVVGNLSLSNSRFVNNGTSGCNYSAGGTLCARGGTVAISNCVFSGAYGWGGTSDPLYDGYHLVHRRKDVVLVTINYRTGIFGFFAHLKSAAASSSSHGRRISRSVTRQLCSFIEA